MCSQDGQGLKYYYHSTQRTASFLTVACVLCFVVYSLYIYMGEQRDIVALAHYITSGGDTLDSIFISALLGTLLAALPSVLLLRFFPFPIRLKAVATLPSFVILGILTGARMQSIQDSDIHLPVFSGCMMMTVAIALCVASLSLREDHAEHNTVPHYMCSNVVILSLGVLMSIIVSNHNRELHDQLLVERLMHQGDTRQALDVGTDYTVQNRNITAMHALALSREGRLADELFSQPGLKGSESLIPDTAPACRIYLAPCMVARHIQAAIMPGARMSTARFLEKAMEMRQQAMADTLRMQQDSLSIQPLADYYLCSLLLDRKLSEFVRRLPQFYAISDSMPRHYREAYILAQRRHINDGTVLEDEEITTAITDFIQIMAKNAKDSRQQRKVCLDMYGGTYWSYYFFKR